MTKNTLKHALKWFEIHDINAFQDDGSIYINIDGHFELQISNAEIEYRANLNKELCID